MTTSHGTVSDDDAGRVSREGDWIEVAGVGEASPRRGVILDVLGEGQHTHFRVRWDEEHESFFYPGTDHYVVHPGGSRPASGVQG